MKKLFYLFIFLFSCHITALSELKFQIETVNADSGVLLVPQQYSTIQSAIDHSSRYFDTVLVSPGIYYENINFKGKRVVVKGNGPAESVIINGSQPTDPNRASVVTFNTGEIGFSILDGFTITGGRGSMTYLGKIGGGIYIENSKPIIKNCIIKNNTAGRGGGLACEYLYEYQELNTGIIINCIITRNTADSYGGGIYTYSYGNINMNYCTIAENSSNAGSNIALLATGTAFSSSIKNTILWAGTVALNSPSKFNYCDIQGGWPFGEGNINADPIFCDAELSDFRLASNSPCIGTGENGTTMGALGTCGQEYSSLFNYPLEIGSTWAYKYDYVYSHFSVWAQRKGLHTWAVIDSSTLIGEFTRFSIRSINKDTVSDYINPIQTLVIDTTYFYIDRGPDVVIVRPPSNVYPVTDNIQGFFSGNQTIHIGGRVYKEGLGLISLYFFNMTNTYYRELLELEVFNGNPVFTEEELSQVPTNFLLSQNYPNPFNPSTRINYKIPNAGFVSLKVYDVLGNEVATLVDEYRNAGSYEIEFNASNFPSGVYFYQLKVGDYLETRKMILLK